MSDIMRPMKFDHPMNWILGEYETQKTIFGVRAFAKTSGAARPIFNEKIETPFGLIFIFSSLPPLNKVLFRNWLCSINLYTSRFCVCLCGN